MKKPLTISVSIVIGIVFFVAVIVGIVGTRFVWQLHPWTPAGSSIAVGHWQFGEFEFQAWQRKNESTFEPFADGLFVRQGTNQWQVFCFDIQDSYSPKVSLQKKDLQIFIYRDGENRGVYDMATQTFKCNGQLYAAADITGNPPGEWWFK